MTRTRVGWIMIALFVLSAASVLAQSSHVTGEVLFKDGRPAVNHTVSLADKFAFTDVKGRFRIRDVPYGEYDLRVSRNKKVNKEMKVKISQPNTAIPTIRLSE
jgi:hypothetical protein